MIAYSPHLPLNSAKTGHGIRVRLGCADLPRILYMCQQITGRRSAREGAADKGWPMGAYPPPPRREPHELRQARRKRPQIRALCQA